MFKKQYMILFFVLLFSTPAFSSDNQSEGEKSSLTDSTGVVKLEIKENQLKEATLPEVEQESDTEAEESSAFDDEHG